MKEVQAYLSKLPPDQRKALTALADQIRAAVPEAVDGFGYGVPGFKWMGRPLVSYGAAKAHVALYLQTSTLPDDLQKALASYVAGKGTVRFQPDDPLPAALVKKIVKTRLAMILEAEAAREVKRKR